MARWLRKIPILGRAYKMLSETHQRVGLLQELLRGTEQRIQSVEAALEQTMKNVDDVKRDLSIQCVINKGIAPSQGMADVQAGLIRRLPSFSDEFGAYNRLPIEHLIGYADGKTVIATHYAKLFSEYASANNIPDIEPVGIEPARLPEACSGKDTLIIANPSLSALIITSPDSLRNISRKLSKNLILVTWGFPYPVYVNWEGFSVIQQDEQGIYRWALGKHSSWSIQLLSGLSTPVPATLRWRAEALDNAGMLSASCCGETVQEELCQLTEFELNVLLEPGINTLSFSFSGTPRAPGSDRRILAFRIASFSCSIEGEDVLKNFLDKNGNILLSDNFIRHALHKNGFYDVTSSASAHHGFSNRKLASSRYRYVAGTIHTRIVGNPISVAPSGSEIVCYHAYRLRRTEEV